MTTTIIFTVLFLVYFLYNKDIRNSKMHSISRDSSNSLKGIMAIAVILHHLSQRTDIHFMNYLFLDFGPIAVGCFFFISGYGLIASYEAKGNSYLTGFPLKRIRKLFIPFLFVIILFQLISTDSPDIIYCFSKGNVGSILPYSWYVFCAILFYFIFYWVFRYSKSEIRGIIWIFIWTCFLFGILKFLMNYSGTWWSMLFLFPIGAFVKRQEKINIINKAKSLNVIYYCISITLLIIFINIFHVGHTRAILYNLISLVYVFALMTINVSFKPLKWLGNISYEIYLVQGIIFYILQKFINDDLCFVILSLIFIIILAYIVKYVLNKFDVFICRIFKLD